MEPINNLIEIKRLKAIDLFFFKQLILLFNNVFKTINKELPDDVYLKKILDKNDFVVFVVIDNNELIGGVTAYELVMYQQKEPELFIYDIAIKPAFQRKGFGKILISNLKHYCNENGIKQMFVAANESDKEAVKFYHSTNGIAEKAIHFNY